MLLFFYQIVRKGWNRVQKHRSPLLLGRLKRWRVAWVGLMKRERESQACAGIARARGCPDERAKSYHSRGRSCPIALLFRSLHSPEVKATGDGEMPLIFPQQGEHAYAYIHASPTYWYIHISSLASGSIFGLPRESIARLPAGRGPCGLACARLRPRANHRPVGEGGLY